MLVRLVVAVSTAVDQFFPLAGRWQYYRQTVERLKTEGGCFVQLTGRYSANGAAYAAAYPLRRAGRGIIQSDVEVP